MSATPPRESPPDASPDVDEPIDTSAPLDVSDPPDGGRDSEPIEIATDPDGPTDRGNGNDHGDGDDGDGDGGDGSDGGDAGDGGDDGHDEPDEPDDEDREPPEPPPVPLEPAERTRARVLSALVLALTAGMVAMYSLVEEPAPGPPALEPTAEFEQLSRLIVAFNDFGERFPALRRPDDQRQRLEQLHRMAADRPADQVRVAIVEAEMRGTHAGLAALDRIDPADDATAADIDALQGVYRAARDAAAEDDRAGATYQLPTPFDTGVAPDEQRRFVERHGWFAELGLSHRQPRTDPRRGRALAHASSMLVISIGVVLVVGSALITGLVLLSVAAVLRVRGKLARGYRRPGEANLPLLETVAVFLGLMLLGHAAAVWARGSVEANLVLALHVLLALVLLWPLVRGMKWRPLRTAMGWHKGQGLVAEAGWGLVGYIAGVPILLAGLAVTIVLSNYVQAQPSHPAVEALRSADLGVVVLILALALVWAPLVEESLFRGALYHYLRRGWSALLAGLASGLLFALVHPQGWTFVPALGAVGLVLAMIREWRGSLVGPIVAHAFHNLMILSLAFMLLG